jgi:hypothetical protein
MKAAAVVALVTMTTLGCGQPAERQQAPGPGKNAAEAQHSAEDVSKGAAGAAQGTGVQPVSVRALQALLPEPFDWQREKPTGERNTTPVNFVDASVRMMKGDATVTVKITDSAVNEMLLAPFASVLAGGSDRKSEHGYEKSVTIGDAPGFERWDSETKTGNLTVIVNRRYIVEVDGSSIDTPRVLRDILGKTDLKKLADLK